MSPIEGDPNSDLYEVESLGMAVSAMHRVLLLVMTDWDYQANVIAFLVPKQIESRALQMQWHEETGKPVKWKNQHGEGVSKNRYSHSMSFGRWLSERYPQIELEYVEVPI